MGEEAAAGLEAGRSSFLKRAFAWRHVRTLWIPFWVVLLCLFAGTGIRGWSLRHVASVCGWLYLAGLGYFLVLAVVRFVAKRKVAGLGALLCLVICGVMFVPALLVALVMGSAGDGFADGLKVPEGLEVVEPGRGASRGEVGGAEDVFQAALRASLDSEGGGDSSVRAEVPALARLWSERRELLMRYLASHPGWRVYEDKKGKFATRRWMAGDRWWMSLHGYYSWFQPTPPKPGVPSFQTRTTLGFSGKPWGNGGQRLAAGELAKVELKEGNGMLQSYVTFEAGGVLVELFEQGEVAERRMTKAAIAEMEREFSALAEVKDWEEAKGLLPEGVIERGEERIELMNSSQPGIYNAAVWCNPGEAGRVYLKAFEVTREYELSADRIKLRTNEWSGWSADAGELFFTEMHFTIYEGDWDQPYAARVELWFEPDSGEGERKLTEDIFRVEGWMR